MAEPSSVRLRDGRRLAYAEHGDLGGAAVLYLPGGGDSRLSRHPDDSIAADAGIRLIAVDRPGCGGSDFRRRRTLVEWTDDVTDLADALALDRFAVLGWSAGGPHALACAWALGERVTHASVVAGMPLPDQTDVLPRDLRMTLRLARRAPLLARRPLTIWSRRAPAPTGDPACDGAYAAGRAEAFRQGSRGLAWELRLLGRDWGFRLDEIRVPVSLWYGEHDRVCPPQIGRDLAARIPGAELHVVDDRHQLLFSRWRELLEELATPGRRAAAAPRTGR
jgi:pimeloyl-ACP methyl ester carboxylesterase